MYFKVNQLNNKQMSSNADLSNKSPVRNVLILTKIGRSAVAQAKSEMVICQPRHRALNLLSKSGSAGS